VSVPSASARKLLIEKERTLERTIVKVEKDFSKIANETNKIIDE